MRILHTSLAALGELLAVGAAVAFLLAAASSAF